MNISKETKQLIATNYMKFKSSELIKELELLNNNKFFEIRNLIYKIENITEDDVISFCENLKKMDKKYAQFFQFGQRNSDSPFNSKVSLSMYNNKLYTNYNFDKVNFKENDFDYKHTSVLNESFECYKNGFLEKDGSYLAIMIKYHKREKEIESQIQNHYDNLYELIRNIRTIERIEKRFPDVENYLPEDLKFNTCEDMNIQDKFNNL